MVWTQPGTINLLLLSFLKKPKQIEMFGQIVGIAIKSWWFWNIWLYWNWQNI